jgi:ORF6N domain-containing protein
LRLRGHNVMLDSDLAALYGVAAKALNQAVKRNRQRFPADFMFRLTDQEAQSLRSHVVTAKWGGRRTAPYAFTEQGVAMLSSVLRSPRAVRVNVEIMRAFVRLRQMLDTSARVAMRLYELEAKCDKRFAHVFAAIRELSSSRKIPARRIGFMTLKNSPAIQGLHQARGAAVRLRTTQRSVPKP